MPHLLLRIRANIPATGKGWNEPDRNRVARWSIALSDEQRLSARRQMATGVRAGADDVLLRYKRHSDFSPVKRPVFVRASPNNSHISRFLWGVSERVAKSVCDWKNTSVRQQTGKSVPWSAPLSILRAAVLCVLLLFHLYCKALPP